MRFFRGIKRFFSQFINGWNQGREESKPIKKPDVAVPVVPVNANLKTNKAGVDLILHFEGWYPYPYKDPIGIPTIGYGTIEYPDGTPVKLTDEDINKEQGREFLEYEIKNKEQGLTLWLEKKGVELNPNQFSALSSFIYNLGLGIVTQSHRSMNQALLSGNMNKVADTFLIYNRAGGRRLKGLVRRRKAERELFLS